MKVGKREKIAKAIVYFLLVVFLFSLIPMVLFTR